MQTIYLPTFAAFQDDVKTMLGILESKVLQKHSSKFRIGLETGGKPTHFTAQEGLDRIVENIWVVAGGTPTIVHGFSGLEVYEINRKKSDLADMSKDTGKELLLRYIGLEKRLGGSYVHVHGSAGYRGIEIPDDKPQVLARIRANLSSGLERATTDANIDIGIENLPSPSCCDFDKNSENVWSDYIESIGDCLQVVNGTQLKVTLDTAHYALNKKNFDLIEGVKRLGNHLNHIHVCDISGYWEPNKSLSYDGLIPGEGGIGQDSFAQFFKYIRENHPDIGICTEVKPKDFKNPVEFRESIRRVLRWLEAA